MADARSKEEARSEAKRHLETHAHAIDTLHHKLAALQDAHDTKGKEQLHHAVEKYKKAHQVFVDDVLACVPLRG